MTLRDWWNHGAPLRPERAREYLGEAVRAQLLDSDRATGRWRVEVRASGIVEAICPHGVGHPTKASVALCGPDSGIHGCDGCCSRIPPDIDAVGTATAALECQRHQERVRIVMDTARKNAMNIQGRVTGGSATLRPIATPKSLAEIDRAIKKKRSRKKPR